MKTAAGRRAPQGSQRPGLLLAMGLTLLFQQPTQLSQNFAQCPRQPFQRSQVKRARNLTRADSRKHPEPRQGYA